MWKVGITYTALYCHLFEICLKYISHIFSKWQEMMTFPCMKHIANTAASSDFTSGAFVHL